MTVSDEPTMEFLGGENGVAREEFCAEFLRGLLGRPISGQHETVLSVAPSGREP